MFARSRESVSATFKTFKNGLFVVNTKFSWKKYVMFFQMELLLKSCYFSLVDCTVIFLTILNYVVTGRIGELEDDK